MPERIERVERVDRVSAPRRRGRPRRDARAPDAPTTKQLILLAAAEAFAGRGFDGASLVDIAAGCGLSTGAVYSHFRGKPELLLQVVATTLDAVTDQLTSVGDSSPEQLHAWVTWLIEPEQVQLRALIAEIQHAALRDPEVRELLAGYGVRYVDLLAVMIEGWQASGQVTRTAPPPVVAQLFLTQALGLCSTGSFQPDLLRSRRFRALLDRQLRMLLGEPG